MISIRRLLELPNERDLLDAAFDLRRLLQDVLATRTRLSHEAGMVDFELKSRGLLRRLGDAATVLDLVVVANEALEAIEEHRQLSTEQFKE